MSEMKLVTKNISEIKPSPYNPRTMSASAMEGLEKSMETFGYVDPIVWNKKTGNIVGGHQRYEILRKQGKDKIKVIEVELSEKEERALNITLNNQSIQGEWDNDRLQSILKELKNEKFFGEVGLESLEIPAFNDFLTGSAEGATETTGETVEGGIIPNSDQELYNRIIITYDSKEEKEALESFLGFSFGKKITFRAKEICNLKEGICEQDIE